MGTVKCLKYNSAQAMVGPGVVCTCVGREIDAEGKGVLRRALNLGLKLSSLPHFKFGLNSTKSKYSPNYISSKFTTLNKTASAVC